MKKVMPFLLMLFLIQIFSINTYSKTNDCDKSSRRRRIHIQGQSKDIRAVSSLLSTEAYIENNILTIYFKQQPFQTEISIRISDISKNYYFEQNFNIFQPLKLSLPIKEELSDKENYEIRLLEIATEYYYLYGTF